MYGSGQAFMIESCFDGVEILFGHCLLSLILFSSFFAQKLLFCHQKERESNYYLFFKSEKNLYEGNCIKMFPSEAIIYASSSAILSIFNNLLSETRVLLLKINFLLSKPFLLLSLLVRYD
jgi:hypothetical protein